MKMRILLTALRVIRVVSSIAFHASAIIVVFWVVLGSSFRLSGESVGNIAVWGVWALLVELLLYPVIHALGSVTNDDK